MANLLLQVTIPASGKVQIISGLPSVTGGPGITASPLPTGNIFVQQLLIQNNATHSIRVGDVTVSSTRGILIASGTPGGTSNFGAFMNYGTYLSDWWIAGTSGDVIDVLYIQ